MSQYEVMEMDISQEDSTSVSLIQNDHTTRAQLSDTASLQRPDDNIVESNVGLSSTQVYSVMPSGHNTGSKPNLMQTNVNLLHLSPKPAASNVETSQNEFREKDKSKQVENDKGEEESQSCPICLEKWSNSGPHRLSSLNCGHLFGRGCIERWLRTKGRDKCPQCNAPAKRHQIRNIYASVIKTFDTAERDANVEELIKERIARIDAEKKQKQAEEARLEATLQCQMMKLEYERMRVKAEDAQRRAEDAQKKAEESVKNFKAECEKMRKDLVKNQVQSLKSFNQRFIFEKSVHIAQNDARVMAFDWSNCALIASKPSPYKNNCCYGIVKVNCMDFKASKYIAIHSKPIRDAVFSPHHADLLLTTGLDKKLQITNMHTDCTVLSYQLPAASWSCCWDMTDPNYMFAGLRNGECHIFDIRNTRETLQVLSSQDTFGLGLVSLAFVPGDPSGKMKPPGLLVCSLETGYFWEKESNYEWNTNLQFPAGAHTCLRYDPETQHCILSQRSTKECNKSRHTCLNDANMFHSTMFDKDLYEESFSHLVESVLAGYNDIYDFKCESLLQFSAGTSRNRLCHSTTFTCPENKRLYGCVGDEASNTVLLWDTLTGERIQEIPSQETAIDVCTFQMNNTYFLGVLTEQNLSFYKWNS